MRVIQTDLCDVMVAGGTEATITGLGVGGFNAARAMSTRNDDPQRASRPFDLDRDGFVIGEGAGCVVLEPLERARARGATIYGEVAGYGRNADAYHITAPSPGGAGAAVCMQLALDDAGVEPSAIGHVNAHGTSTPLNDAAEAEAVRKVFGDSAPVVTSTKGVTGHLIGAAGAVEAVAALLSVRDGIVPPTANLEKLGDDIELDVVAGSPREIGPKPAISNSFGFGGHNACLVIAAAD
jgi:3-oxoacyl-[acyl-carrier-protein] synthase II